MSWAGCLLRCVKKLDRSNDQLQHTDRKFLMQAWGAEIEKIDARVEAIKSGDLFLLCSDGLDDMLSDDGLLETLIVPPRTQSVLV